MSSRSEEYKRLWAKAIAALARREHSASELTQKLLAKSDEPQTAAAVIKDLIADDYLSDERFCEMLCRSRFNKGIGPLRLHQELTVHQVDALIVEAMMGQFTHRWVERLIEIRIKKYGEQPPSTYKEWAKQARFLQQRGFSSEHIRLALEPFKSI